MFAYRVMFYVVRAYQDPFYRMLRICEGAEFGKGSMGEAVDGTEPATSSQKRAMAWKIRQVLEAGCPGYLGWFRRWRSTRNRIKEGQWTPHVDADLGIVPQFVQDDGALLPDGAHPAPVTLGDVVEAIELSATLARFTRDRLDA